MKKKITYSMRMNVDTRGLLKKAAADDSRTVASLLDKIINDYLYVQGYIDPHDREKDRRRAIRKKKNLPAITVQEQGGETKHFPCLVLDISSEGMKLSFPKGSQFQINSIGEIPRFQVDLPVPELEKSVNMNCSLSHIRDAGDEIQIGCKVDPENFADQQILQRYLI